MYFEAIDLIVESINLRFTQPSFKAYEELECLILNARQSKDLEDGLQFLKLNYSGDVDVTALRSQLCLLPAVFKDALGNIFCLDNFLNELKELPNEERQLIRHVVTISKLLHVNPATSASRLAHTWAISSAESHLWLFALAVSSSVRWPIVRFSSLESLAQDIQHVE